MLGAVHHSLSVVIGACLLLLALDLLGRDEPVPAAAGIALGLGYLVRPEMLPAAAILAAFTAVRVRPSAGVRLVIAFALVAGGWWIHQWRATGMPLFNLSSYGLIGTFGSRPEYTVMRDFDLTPDRWPQVLHHELPGLWRKWVAFLPRACRHGLTATGWSTGWCVPIGAWMWLRSKRARAWTWACAILALLPIAMMTAAVPQKLYLVPFIGLYALAAARGFAAIVARAGAIRAPRLWVPALAILMLAALLPAARDAAREGLRERDLLASERSVLASLAATSPARASGVSPLFSDRADFVAWTTGRPTLYVSLDEYLALYPSDGPLDADRPHGLPRRREPLDTWFHAGHWAVGRHAPS
jgi:hypothetical protein